MFTIDFNVISFVLSCVSIFIGIFAVWQAREYKNESSILNEITRKNLEDMKVHSVIISQYAIPELKAYGESMRALIYEQKISKEQSFISKNEDNIPTKNKQEAKNINGDLISEIDFLTKNIGKATSIELFSRLKHSYNFSSILQELISMNRDDLVTWKEAPSPPDAMSEIKILQQKR